jgi:anhydro-N-acetylmuramic acid kinase
VDFSEGNPQLLASLSKPLSSDLRKKIHDLASPSEDEIDRMGKLDRELGLLFAQTVNDLISSTAVHPSQIKAIGSHGQTIRHRPPQNCDQPFTLQIGDPNQIAHHTGVTTVADFRRRDMAAGGQGAPLVPAFHKAIFHADEHDRAILNIGGMANITWLPKCGSVIGFDTGPGNVLMDAWILKHHGKAYDANGDWAASGSVNIALLERLLEHPFFALPPPKSTGREAFNQEWLLGVLSGLTAEIEPKDVQATLLCLSTHTIVNAMTQLSTTPDELFVCGGGAYNEELLRNLRGLLPHTKVKTTASLGVNPEWVEAMAFAWLAQQTMCKLSGNLCAVTGAQQEVILGGVYFA